MGKRLQLRLLSDALTGEWREGEGGEGQGSEPREPRGPPPPGRRCVMKGPPLGAGGEDITWRNQVAPRGRKASSTQNLKPQTSNLKPQFPYYPYRASKLKDSACSLIQRSADPP